MSPEYGWGGIISEKSDIYSFGVLLLEIISGKKANKFVHNDHNSLINYVSVFYTYHLTLTIYIVFLFFLLLKKRYTNVYCLIKFRHGNLGVTQRVLAL